MKELTNEAGIEVPAPRADGARGTAGELPPERPEGGRKKRRSKLEIRESRIAFGFISVKLIGFIVFTLIPVAACIIYSFSNMDPQRFPNTLFTYLGNEKFWAGFKQYADLFTHPLYSQIFLRSILNTVLLMFSVPLGMAGGLLLAAVLSQKDLKLKSTFRLLIYLPVVASAVAMGYIWQYLFATEYGLLNQLFGINVNWFSNVHLTRLAIIIKNTWGSLGRTMILYIAGCLSVSDTYYDAAEIDGASRWTKFWKITFPLVTPTTFYLLVMGIIGNLQSYNDSVIFAPGSQGSQTVVWFIWNYGIYQRNYGLAAAASVLLSIVIMALTVLQFKRSNKWVYSV